MPPTLGTGVRSFQRTVASCAWPAACLPLACSLARFVLRRTCICTRSAHSARSSDFCRMRPLSCLVRAACCSALHGMSACPPAHPHIASRCLHRSCRMLCLLPVFGAEPASLVPAPHHVCCAVALLCRQVVPDRACPGARRTPCGQGRRNASSLRSTVVRICTLHVHVEV